jgi:hypothetical protein
MDSYGEIRNVKCSLAVVKEIDLLSPTHSLRSLREGSAPLKHQENEPDISWISRI